MSFKTEQPNKRHSRTRQLSQRIAHVFLILRNESAVTDDAKLDLTYLADMFVTALHSNLTDGESQSQYRDNVIDILNEYKDQQETAHEQREQQRREKVID